MVKRHYYHITIKELGDSPILKAIEPIGIDETEPLCKRLCVAPSIIQCFASINHENADTYNIYKTQNKIKANEPFKVNDCHITDEKWVTRPTQFVKIGKFNAANFTRQDFRAGAPLHIPEQILWIERNKQLIEKAGLE